MFEFLDAHQWIVTATIIPLIGIIVGIASSYVSNKQIKKSEKERCRFECSVRIAEFRQQWIADLRNTMAEFQSYGICPNSDPSMIREFYHLGTKIELLMNPNDQDYALLQKALYNFLKSANGDILDKYSNNAEYLNICQRILKREWERLKMDLSDSSL